MESAGHSALNHGHKYSRNNIDRMEYYFITGSSRGIGAALVNALIQRSNSFVFGMARNITVADAARFQFIPIDLGDQLALDRFNFPDCEDATKIVLVNNAGIIGEVGYAGEIGNDAYRRVYDINLTAPCVLTNKFLAAYAGKKVSLVILNISSGAGKNAIDGWSAYCASKAGLDMFSRTVAEELAISGQNHIRIFAVAPGIVDTAMQDHIRTTNEKNFSRVNQFVEYKSTGQLADPAVVAAKLLSILDLPRKFPDTVFSVKDLQD
jgi:benzil reductase ((S)-benzoin forming)